MYSLFNMTLNYGNITEGTLSSDRENNLRKEKEKWQTKHGESEGSSSIETGSCEEGKRTFVKRRFIGYRQSIFDLTGLKTDMLTVISKSDVIYIHLKTGKMTRPFWNVKCECENIVIRPAFALMQGKAKSCGCYANEFIREARTIHNGVGTPTYNIWTGIRKRCFDTGSTNYAFYGGSGITMCNRWRYGDEGYSGYECFLSDMGERPEGLQIDRKNNKGNYCPENCVWSNRKDQCRNRRNSRYFEWKGKGRTLSEIAEMEGIKFGTFKSRVLSGMSVESAITTPNRRPRKTTV